MISFHRWRDESQPWRYSKGWERACITDMDRIARGISQFVWSPIFFDNGWRGEQYFEVSHWCAYDFDSPEFTLKDAERAFADSQVIIGTTRSHQKAKGDHAPCDRFRVLTPWEQPIDDLRTYRFNMELLARKYEMDKACLDGARLFFRCRTIEVVSYEGYKQPVVEPPSGYSLPKDVYDPRRHHKRLLGHKATATMPKWTAQQLLNVVPIGKRATTFYGVAKDLTLMGYSHQEIYEQILISPTYGGSIDCRKTQKKLDEAIASGVKKIERELHTTRSRRNDKPN